MGHKRGIGRSRVGAIVSALGITLALGIGCTRTEWKTQYAEVPTRGQLRRDAPFLKLHTYDGELYVLEHWKSDEAAHRFIGRGVHYDSDRREVDRGQLAVGFERIVLLETNEPTTVTNGGIPLLGVITTASLVLTTFCLTTPKACFGSCPTFYAFDGRERALQAEGFSESVLRAFEKTDVDELATARPDGRRLSIEMRNEALETHMVRSVRVLAVPRPPGTRVHRAGERYWVTKNAISPLACRSASGGCLESMRSMDGIEYASLADGRDLATRETIELDFPAAKGRAALLIVARNSLLNTFLLYQALAYAGKNAGEWIVRFEREAKGREQLIGFARRLGGIQVDVRRGKRFVPSGEFFEVGPIARETQLIELPDRGGERTQVRLSLTQGNWKIDQVALVELDEPSAPIAVQPTHARRGGKSDPKALTKLRDPDAYLATYPGDTYELEFELPDGDLDLFLESTGYYYEWIRGEWLKDEDTLALLAMFADPEGTLRRLAPLYKRIEPEMDRVFWQSRVRGAVP